VSSPDLRSLPAIPRDDDGPVFRAPWEAQAFALAVLLNERGVFTWPEWSARLADQIAAASERGDDDDGRRYYRHWLAALESLVAEKELVADDELRARHDAWTEAARSTPHGKPIVLPGR
jgi:nitrile hydratase accessory protein